MSALTIVTAIKSIRSTGQVPQQLRTDLISSLTNSLEIDRANVEAYIGETIDQLLPHDPKQAVSRILWYDAKKGHLPLRLN